MELLWSMSISFLKIGAFSFGGGYAVLAFIQKEVIESHAWISPENFVNIVAIAEMTPGPIAVNSSTFVGYNLFGIGGGLICTICVLLIPFCLSLLVAIYFDKFKENQYLKRALAGIRPVVIGLIAASCLSIGKISMTGLSSFLIFAAAFFLVYKMKWNPILVLILAGISGVLIYGLLASALPILQS